MYDALTPLFDQVTAADLMTKFKSEHFGVGEDGPGVPETVPRAGVTIVRDRFNVPHITGASRDDVTWAMGWVLAQDRGLLLGQARDAARLAAIDAPNIDAFGLVVGLRRYTPTKAVDRIIQRQGDAALKAAGAAGTAVRHDIDIYLKGSTPGWAGRRHAAVDARRHLRHQRDHGPDLRSGRRRRGAPHRVPLQLLKRYGRAGTGHLRRPVRVRRPGFARDDQQGVPLRQGSARQGQRRARRRLLQAGRPARARARGERASALVEQLPARRREPLGDRASAVRRRPADRLHVPGPDARGRHHLPGRAGARRDLARLRRQHPDRPRAGLRLDADLGGLRPDRHLRRALCGGSRTKYLYNGRCRTMGSVDAGAIEGAGRVKFRTTVHGPVTGYAKVRGRTVAVSRKRASYGQDILWQLGFRDLTTGKVESAATLREAMSTSPFTFNVGYADDRDIAMYSAGRLPVRDRRVDPRLPAGHGRVRVGGLPAHLPAPVRGQPAQGLLVNWNNRPARTGAPPTTTGPTARCSACRCSTTAWRPRTSTTWRA